MSAIAQLLLGETLFVGRLKKRDLCAAFLCFTRGCTWAREDVFFYAAWCLERGHGVAVNEDRARQFYELSANNEFPLAQAWCALHGVRGFEEFEPDILETYQEETLDESTICERLFRPFLLGEAHENGLFGLESDMDAAITCYRVAAARGLVDAEQRLVALHADSSALKLSVANVACVTAPVDAIDISELRL